MKVLLALFIVSLIGSQAFSQWATIGGTYLNPGVTYVSTGQSVATVSSGTYAAVATRTTTAGKTFYLTSLSMEGFLNTISASAARLGQCSLQMPTGSTVAYFNFNNMTTSQIDRQSLNLPYPLAVTQSLTISCIPSSSTSTWWNATFSGFEN